MSHKKRKRDFATRTLMYDPVFKFSYIINLSQCWLGFIFNIQQFFLILVFFFFSSLFCYNSWCKVEKTWSIWWCPQKILKHTIMFTDTTLKSGIRTKSNCNLSDSDSVQKIYPNYFVLPQRFFAPNKPCWYA